MYSIFLSPLCGELEWGCFSYFRCVNKIRFVFRYLRYLLKARTRHGTHSPFVYNLLEEVIYDTSHFYVFDEIESLREKLLRDERTINIKDYGAGSTINSSPTRKLKDIAGNSAKAQKYGQLMFRLIQKFKPQTLLELGTSLGISTVYQASAAPKSKLITMEGCPETASVAKQNFEKLKLNNVEIVVGNFDETLSSTLNTITKLDYVFFDGNHRKAPTLDYFKQCLTKINNDSVFIFDDIHWSNEMEEAWEEIKANPSVTVTIDLFFVGLVFFRKEQKKQDFIIRF
ncbi:MAG: hypothetical protein POELPBGB_01430 [Bacteroidia bacterium]|nr:hypothetical protein [Bacteroidia bacterium]